MVDRTVLQIRLVEVDQDGRRLVIFGELVGGEFVDLRCVAALVVDLDGESQAGGLVIDTSFYNVARHMAAISADCQMLSMPCYGSRDTRPFNSISVWRLQPPERIADPVGLRRGLISPSWGLRWRFLDCNCRPIPVSLLGQKYVIFVESCLDATAIRLWPLLESSSDWKGLRLDWPMAIVELAVSRDVSLLAVRRHNDDVLIVDLVSDGNHDRLKCHLVGPKPSMFGPGGLSRLSFSPDGRLLAAAYGREYLLAWDLNQIEPRQPNMAIRADKDIDEPVTASIDWLELGPDGWAAIVSRLAA